MNLNWIGKRVAAGAWLALVFGLMWAGNARAAEQTFDVLQIGTRSFTNVTVTTKSANYVFLMHAGGLINIKVADLPYEAKVKLGYLAEVPRPSDEVAAHTLDEPAPAAPPKAFDPHHPLVWLRQKLAGTRLAQSPQFQRFVETARQEENDRSERLRHMDVTTLSALAGALLIIHIFFGYCCMLICRKASRPGGWMVWTPGFQVYALIRAAGMSGWWMLAYFVPLLNFLAVIVWAFEIAKARGKSVWVGVLLLVPLVNFCAFLYLAFSDGEKAAEPEAPRKEIMTLETA